MKNFSDIFPKWAKIALFVLSSIAIVLLVGAFALQKWADSQVESANLAFSKIDKNKSAELENAYAYEARVHFERLDFLLRSRTISHIDIKDIAWASGIDSTAIKSIESHNRRLNFTTTQNLALDSGANLGTMNFKMDFAPLPKDIIKYYLIAMIVFALTLFLCKSFTNEITKFYHLIQNETLPRALYQSYKSINPLYRHSFWIVFIACNVVFGFHTIHFLLGNHDWNMAFGNNWAFLNLYEGRYTQGIIRFVQGWQLLPFVNNILAFASLALASVWLCMYLNIQRKLWLWASIGLLLTLQPFTLVKMYYAYQITGDFFAVAIGILGFVLAKKAGKSSPNHLNNSGVGNSLSLSLSLS